MKALLFISLILSASISFSQSEDTSDLKIPDGVLRVRALKKQQSHFSFIKPENISFFFGGVNGNESHKMVPYYVGIYSSPEPKNNGRSIWSESSRSIYSYNIGLRFEYRMGRILSLCPGIGVYQTGGDGRQGAILTNSFRELMSFKVSHRYSYLDFPISIKAMASWLRLHPFFTVGANVGYSLKSISIVDIDIDGISGARDTLTRYGLPLTSYTEKFKSSKLMASFMWSAGLGYYLNRSWEIQLELRGCHSITNAAVSNGIGVNLRTITINVGLTYHFKDKYRRSQYNIQRNNKTKGLIRPDQRYMYQLIADHLSINCGGGINRTKPYSDSRVPALKNGTGNQAFVGLTYLKSKNNSRMSEAYLNYGVESFNVSPRDLYGAQYLFSCFEGGFNYLFIHQNYSRIKPFVGVGVGVKQLFLTGGEGYDFRLVKFTSADSTYMTTDFNFYRIPSVLLRLSTGCFYKFNNGQMLKLTMYVNYGLNRNVVMNYDYFINNKKEEAGRCITNNLNIGFNVGYTVFDLKHLRKMFKKEKDV